jgi:hypothetical protein
VDKQNPAFGFGVMRSLGGVGRAELSYAYSASEISSRQFSLEEELGAQAFSHAKLSVHIARLSLARDLIEDTRGRAFYYAFGAGLIVLDPGTEVLSFILSDLEDESVVIDELSTIVDPLGYLAVGVRWPVGERAALRVELEDNVQLCDVAESDDRAYLCPWGGIKQHLNMSLGLQIPF